MTRFHSFAFRGLGFFLFALGLVMMMNRVADAAALRPNVQVDGAMVTLADLADGPLAEGGEAAVTRAPAPGARKVVAVQEVINLAYSKGVKITNPNGLSRIVVERPGTRIPMSLIRERIQAELTARSVPEPYEIDFSGRNIDLAVPRGGHVDLRVEQFDYDRNRHRFEAVLVAPVDSGRAARQKVFGRVSLLTRVPVLADRMGKRDVIGEGDIVWTTMPTRRVSDDYITSDADLIGKSPRRPLTAERPVRYRDIREPVIVAKNAKVTMVVDTPGLSLTATGRALEDGSAGEMVRVVNTDTHQTISAEVIGPGRVRAVTRSNSIAAR